MNKVCIYFILASFFFHVACVKKAENMVGPTIGSLDIIADESMRDVVQQEEELFERNYKYAKLNITYLNEYDMFSNFMTDSIDVIMTTRALTKDEVDHFEKKNIHPKQYSFAKGAIVFLVNRNVRDTTYTYEEILNLFERQQENIVFVIENARSGITNVILQLIDKPALPAHFYALSSKKEVLEYIGKHDNAIGIGDWSELSDSDNSLAKEMLSDVHVIGISRPVDSIQYGFVKPYQYNLQSDIYPFTRELYFISKTGMSDIGLGFATFITGEIGQKIILKAGLLPKFQTERIIELRNTSDIKVIK